MQRGRAGLARTSVFERHPRHGMVREKQWIQTRK